MKRVIVTPNPYRDKNFATVRRAMDILRASGLDATYPEIAPQKRTTDECPACSHQLHGVDKETLGIYSQTDGVVYQRKGGHRIGLTLYRIDSILDGDLSEIVDALHAADRAAKLQAQGKEA